jgi:putative DNA methylase
MTDERRLIEDYLPIQPISAAAAGEPRTKGHISTLHVWRARRPLVACRAAVYGALVSASRFEPTNGPEEKRASLGRANAAKFVERLCQYPGNSAVIAEAQRHILEAHAERLTTETGKGVTIQDVEAERAPRPKILDMFAGGGAIPLEALRLGCEAHAVELNPVAHLIELCTVTFPQRYGPGLADEVEKWGRSVLERTRAAVTDLYAKIPAASKKRHVQSDAFSQQEDSKDFLSVVAYYWTRTIPCPNRQCEATVPLYRQTWLRKKASGYVALKPILDNRSRKVRFRVVTADSEGALDFDPGEGSEGSATVCPFCQAPVAAEYVRDYGNATGFGQQLMCVIALNPHGSGKLYLADEMLADGEQEREMVAEERAKVLEVNLGSTSLDETIPPTGNAGLATGKSYLYGINTFRQAFTPRQRCVLLTLAIEIRLAHHEMLAKGIDQERAKTITTYLGLWLSRLTDRFNGIARWDNSRETVVSLSSMKRFAMMWDYPEVNLFGGATGDAWGNLEYITAVIRQEGSVPRPATCVRGSATELAYASGSFDAVITDPPYYDNESYSELSDVSYVWLRPTIGFLFPEHFAGSLTPKKQECVAAAYRQGGTKDAAYHFFEDCLFKSLEQAARVLKPSGILVMVYAHKTTAGWGSLMDSIRRAGFEVAEAWPLDTEAKARVAHQEDAALASSIFLVARKRDSALTGNYEEEVRPELEQIVRERVGALWEMGISGADLVIASVGAGLRAFTRFARVEYANGEEVPAERFLAEVEAVVLDSILAKLSKAVGANGGRYSLAGLDPSTRFYILWRYTYGSVELDAGEAIVFANGTHVELDGSEGLSAGERALTEKKKGKYRLRDYAERGADEDLGLPSEEGQPAPLVDTLHRTMWLMEKRPAKLGEFLKEARPNREQLRLVAQALAGPALKGGELGEVATGGELAALTKLTANWRALMERAEEPLFERR